MSYDKSKYRELAPGETVTLNHFMQGSGDMGLIPVGNHYKGILVTGDQWLKFYEPIAPKSETPMDIFAHAPVPDPKTIHPERAPKDILKDVYGNGAARSKQQGRGRFDLIPYEAMVALAKRYEMGAVHFGDRNWERGQPLSRILSSMRRHSMQTAHDFSEEHVGAVLWNAAAFVTIVERIRKGQLPKELDDVHYFDNEAAALHGGAK